MKSPFSLCSIPAPRSGASAAVPSVSSHVRVAFESRRKAACAIAAAAAAAAGPRLTRAAKAAAASDPSSSSGKLESIKEQPQQLHPGGNGADPVAIALPPCVPSIDQAGLSFVANPVSMLGQGAYGIVYKVCGGAVGEGRGRRDRLCTQHCLNVAARVVEHLCGGQQKSRTRKATRATA